MNTALNRIEVGQVWRHYKNKDYRIIAISRCTESLVWYVVYEALHENEMSQIWHRPIDMFLESLELDGNLVQRFTHVK